MIIVATKRNAEKSNWTEVNRKHIVLQLNQCSMETRDNHTNQREIERIREEMKKLK